MFCRFCGKDNADGTKFCKHCGKDIGTSSDLSLEGETEILEGSNEVNNTNPMESSVENKPKEKTSLSAGDIVNKIKSNKLLAGGIAAVCLIVFIFLGVKIFGNTIGKDVLKNDLIGKKIGVGSMTFTVSEDNLKSVKVKSEKEKTEQGIKLCEVLGTVVLEDDVFSIEAPFTANYIYSPNDTLGKKGWYSTDFYVDINSTEAKVELNAKVSEDDFKKSLVDKEIKAVKITENMFKDIKISNIEESDFGTRATADFSLNYEGKMLSKNVTCKVTIKFNDGGWQYVGINNAKTLTSVKNDQGDISVEDFIKDFSNIAGQWSIETSYKSRDVATYNVEHIKEIKNIKVSEDVAWNKRRYIIDADIKIGVAKSSAEGPIRIGIVEDQVSGDFRLKATSFAVEAPTKDDIALILTDKTVQHKNGEEILKYKLRAEDIKNFNITEVVQVLPNPRDYAIYGTMSYNGLTDDKVVLFVWYDTGATCFKLREFVSFSIEGYAESKGIEAIKERNATYSEN